MSRDPSLDTVRTCGDCGKEFSGLSDLTVRRGSVVKEKGETICPPCVRERTMMLKAVDALPVTNERIIARRVRGAPANIRPARPSYRG